MTQINNRKFLRIKKTHALSFSILPAYATERKITKDLSLGGVRILVSQFIPLKSVLKITIEFADVKKVITVVGVVQWNRSVYDDECYEAGVKFIEINQEDARFLKTYLRGIYSAQKMLKMRQDGSTKERS